MERTYIITPEEFRTLARPASIHIDALQITQYINECEDIYIMPAIGWANLKACANTAAEFHGVDEEFARDVFVNGGEWAAPTGCNCGEGLQFCAGVKKALAYFVYAKMLKNDGTVLQRAGFMQHREEYGNHAERGEALKQYNDVMDTAEKYLAGCLSYLRAHTLECGSVKPLRGSRCRIHSIGD